MKVKKPVELHALHRLIYCWHNFIVLGKLQNIVCNTTPTKITYKIRQKHPSYHLHAFYAEPIYGTQKFLYVHKIIVMLFILKTLVVNVSSDSNMIYLKNTVPSDMEIIVQVTGISPIETLLVLQRERNVHVRF